MKRRIFDDLQWIVQRQDIIFRMNTLLLLCILFINKRIMRIKYKSFIFDQNSIKFSAVMTKFKTCMKINFLLISLCWYCRSCEYRIPFEGYCRTSWSSFDVVSHATDLLVYLILCCSMSNVSITDIINYSYACFIQHKYFQWSNSCKSEMYLCHSIFQSKFLRKYLLTLRFELIFVIYTLRLVIRDWLTHMLRLWQHIELKNKDLVVCGPDY